MGVPKTYEQPGKIGSFSGNNETFAVDYPPVVKNCDGRHVPKKSTTRYEEVLSIYDEAEQREANRDVLVGKKRAIGEVKAAAMSTEGEVYENEAKKAKLE